MPIQFNLEELRQKHNVENYFETGLYLATSLDSSCNQALKSNFKKIYSVELRKDFIDIAKDILREHIDTGRLTLIHDDSNFISKYILEDETFKNKTLFFLDAHVDCGNIPNYINKCPLFNELSAIKQLNRKDNIICIDDIRILKEVFPWGETSYGDINFVEEIKKQILEINPEYKFIYLNGFIENDVLCAYI
jgi:hypothetical protein